MDVLSDVLRAIRLKGALFLNAEFREPWCVAAPASMALAPMPPPVREPMAICHFVVKGRCWARLADGEPVPIEAGDAVALPHGDAHFLGSASENRPPSVHDAVALKIPEIARTRYGGDGEETVAVCGWFAYESQTARPLLEGLPRLFRTSIRSRPSGAWLESSILYAVGEATSSRSGSNALTDKLAELLFVEALRGYIDTLPDGQTGWLAGLRDPVVGRSLSLLHERPAEPWTVSLLAQAAGTSRSVLAERFVEMVGVPPMQYLVRWRLALAARLLRSGSLSLTRIAEQVGYDSDAAFSRAFKREYGSAPGAWRRMRN